MRILLLTLAILLATAGCVSTFPMYVCQPVAQNTIVCIDEHRYKKNTE